MLVARSAPRPDHGTFLPLLRWLILGAALGLCIIALGRAGAVGAQSPANCIPINQTSCLSNGVIYTNGTPTANIGQPNSVVVPGYAVPGIAYSPYLSGGYVGANYFSPYYGSYYGGYYNNYYRENYGYLGTNCDPKAWWCLNYEYTGNVFANLFSPGTGAATINTPAVAPGGTVIYRPAEVAQPTATAATAMPASAPAAQTATALDASTQAQAPAAPVGGAGVKILSVPSVTAPTIGNDGRDDGK